MGILSKTSTGLSSQSQQQDAPDFARHVGQELRLASVCELGSFPRGDGLLDTFTQVGDHLVELCLQHVHHFARLDSNEMTEIVVHGRCRNLCETSYLGRQVSSHCVFTETLSSNKRVISTDSIRQ